MNRIKQYLFGKLTVTDLVEYFGSMGIRLGISFGKKRRPDYYAKNSRIYRNKK